MSSRRTSLSCVALLLGAAACERIAGIEDISLSRDGGDRDDGGAPDVTADASDASITFDASDATAPVCLHGSLLEPVDSHWAAAGSAVLGTATGAQLTSDMTSQTGAVWWRDPYVFDSFEMTATFSIQAKPDGADGCAFAWVPSLQVPGVGAGPVYGLGGLGGYGVAIDTYSNTNEPPAPFLVVLAQDQRIATQAIPNVRDGRNHTMRVTLEKGKLDVSIDSFKYISELEIPGYAHFPGYWGWTAGGGDAFEGHYLSEMTMSFPNSEACTP